jgi:hypothetical protein
LGVALCAVPALASAGTLGSENGIKVGEGRLHPYFDLELRYDSAAGLFGPANAKTLGAEMIAHFRPGLRLEIPSPTVALNFNGNVDYVFYTGLLNPGSQITSHFESDISLDAAVNREGQVEFDIGDHFVRSDRTTNVAVGLGVLSLFNEVHAALPIKPGGGALEVTPRGAWSMEILTPYASSVAGYADPALIPGMSYNNFRGGLDARWRFLPKTAIVFESAFDSRSYTSAANASMMLLKLQVGIAGLVSPKIATLAMVGWTHGFNATDGRTVTGHFEVSYLASETAHFKLGYLRSIEPVPTYGTYGRDGVYIGSRFMFGGKFSGHVNGGFDYLTFYGNTSRYDMIISADIGPEYQFTPWLIASLNYNMSLRSSTAAQALPRHEGIARIEFTY